MGGTARNIEIFFQKHWHVFPENISGFSNVTLPLVTRFGQCGLASVMWLFQCGLDVVYGGRDPQDRNRVQAKLEIGTIGVLIALHSAWVYIEIVFRACAIFTSNLLPLFGVP